MSTSQSTAGHSHDTRWHPTDYLRIVYKRRWIAVPAFLLVFVSGALETIRAVPIYEARTKVLIERTGRRATSIDAALDDRAYGYYDDSFYMTQYNIIRSRSLALRVAEALEKNGPPERVPEARGFSFTLSGLLRAAESGLVTLLTSVGRRGDAAPAAAPIVAADETVAQAAKIDRVLAGLDVRPIRNSSLVDITFRSPDPQFAWRAVNELANQYRQRNLEARFLDTKEANDFLNAQLKEQRVKVEESEAALVRYRETHNAAGVDDRQNIVIQKLTELNAQVTRAKIDRLDKEALYNQLLQARREGSSLDSAPLVMANEYIQKLKLEIASLEEQRAKMAAQYGPNWPAMKDLTTSLATTRARLDAELDGVVGAVRNDFLAAKAKEDSLVAALNAQKGEAMTLDRKAVEYSALEREAASNRQLYENLLQRTKETGVSQQFRTSNIEIVDRAEIPQTPVLPAVQRDLMLSMLLGLVLAMGLVFGVEYFDSRLKSPDEIKAYLGLPFLGLVPSVSGRNGEPVLLGAKDVPPAFSEAMKAIRTGVVFSSAEDGARSVVVTSTAPHEGKTLVASNLAAALAQTDQRTLVIDADMRRPRMHDVFGWQQEPGLSNVLVGTAALGDAIRKGPMANLSVICAGHIPPNPAELLGTTRFRDLLRDLGKQYDWMIIDAPPVMAVTDASLVGHIATGVVFVVGAEMTSRRHASVAIEQLAAAKARFIGAVLNRANVRRHGYYYSTYYRKDYVRAYTRVS
jgi:capsular exopolysaccharide synthesis family protein